MSFQTIRRNLWNLRFYYFVLVGGGGFLFPFVNLFYTQQGLTGTEIGWLATFSSIAALIAAPWWGRRSDGSLHPRRLLQFGLIATSLCMLGLSQQILFAWMALIVVLDALLSAGVAPLSDVIALSITQGQGSGFGSVRLWGSLGWAVTALAGGWLIEQGETIIGLAFTIGALVELPAMLWADRLVKQIGAGRLLRLSFVLDGLRWGGILIAPSVSTILVSHLISGVSYSFYVVALVAFIGEHAPDRRVTTTMAVFTVTLPALIRILAAPVSGAAFDAFGAYWLYAIAIDGTLAAWVVMQVMVRERPRPAAA